MRFSFVEAQSVRREVVREEAGEMREVWLRRALCGLTALVSKSAQMDCEDLMDLLKLQSKFVSLCVNMNVYFLRKGFLTLIKFSNVRNSHRQ